MCEACNLKDNDGYCLLTGDKVIKTKYGKMFKNDNNKWEMEITEIDLFPLRNENNCQMKKDYEDDNK
jgi:hypothetical protein